MNNCKNCKFWEKVNINNFSNASNCRSPKFIVDNREITDGVTFNFDYGAVRFGEDFGCIHFESKEPTTINK